MNPKTVDVTLHVDENTTPDQREMLRDELLAVEGVMAAIVHDDKPHLFIVEYDPDTVEPQHFLKVAEKQGLHGELVGL